MYSVILSILIGLVISLVVVFDWSNCDKIESACFYALAIPATIPIYLITHLTGWIGLQLYQYN